MKAFADDKINVIQNLIFVLRRLKNIVGKGGKAVYWHFLLFPMFSKGYFHRLLKVGIVSKGLSAEIESRLNLLPIYTHFNTLKKKAIGKHCGKR